MKIMNIIIFIFLVVVLNACMAITKEVKKKKEIAVQEMDTTHTVILSNRPPNDLNSYLSYVRHTIYMNMRQYLHTANNKINGRVNVSFMILSNGHVKILKLSGTRSLYLSARNIIISSFPIDTFTNNIQSSLPIRVNFAFIFHKNF